MFITIIVFLVILSILVFIHEAGHFVAAKRSGIKVEEFGFGLPPRAWGIKRGETIYSINWLPFGGFVKLYGEDEAGAGKVTIKASKKNAEKADTSRAFFAQPLQNRIIVVVAGVFMNLVLAIVLYYIILANSGFTARIPLVFDHQFVGANQSVQSALFVGSVAKASPAEQAGITTEDRIIAYDALPITDVDVFKQYIDGKRGKAINLTLLNKQDQERVVNVAPRITIPPGEGPIGIGFAGDVFKTAILTYETPVQQAFSGVIQTYNIGTYSFEVFGKIVAQSFEKRNIAPVSEGVAGPIGIGRIVNDILGIGGQRAFFALLEFMALLSLNLAVVNILPFPALDGGRLLFLVIEGLTRKRVNPKVEQYANTVGMAFLLGLILLITYNDLLKIFR